MTLLDRSTWLARQSEHALTHDVALDFVGPGPDRAGLVVEPRTLPGTVAGVVGGTAPQRLRTADDRHRRVVQSLAHLAPPQLVDAADRARLLTLRGAGDRPPVVQL